MGKALLYVALLLGLLSTSAVSGLPILYVVVVLLGGIVIRRINPQRSNSEFLPEVAGAVEKLERRRTRTFVLESVKLGIREGAGRYAFTTVPSLIRIEPAVYGADAYFAGLIGQELSDWERAAGRLSTALRVKSVVAREPKPGIFQLELRVRDPLAQPEVVNLLTLPAAWSLPLGLDETGQLCRLPIANVSGVVVGGVPGSGKTAWLTGCMATFSTCESVQFLVIDGKGGQDFSGFAPRCYRMLDDELDLEAVLVALREVQELVRDRMRNLQALLGTSNFWHRGPSPAVPLVFVLVDECQTFLDPRQLVTKEQKAKGSEIHGLLSYLVRKGRAAGVVTILSTQKPTADSLPTDIRDNSTLRVCFGVQSTHAATAVLGDDWRSDSSASPLGAPVGVGVATVGNCFVRFRAPYVPDHVIADYVNQTVGLRVNPAALLRFALNGSR